MKAQQRFLTHRSRHLLLTAFGPQRGVRAVVIVPPFAEEMNKCRRMMALQARALAQVGLYSCYLDFSGTGDSDGELVAASLAQWLEELGALAGLLGDEFGVTQIDLIAIRCGALLGAQAALSLPLPVTRLVLWQPVVDGAAFLKQFLRLRTMAGVIGSQGRRESVSDLRAALATTGRLDVAGYTLSEMLAAELEERSLVSLIPRLSCPVHWFEVQGSPTPSLSPATRRHLQALPATIDARAFGGEPFWSTVEIGLAPVLIDATTAVLT